MSKENVSRLLTERSLSFVANASGVGEADVRPMSFIFHDGQIHYATLKSSNKVSQWGGKCKVAISIANEASSLEKIAETESLRIYGEIKPTEPAIIASIAIKYLEKYPFLKGLSSSPDNSIWYSVKIERVNYAKGFTHDEVITY